MLPIGEMISVYNRSLPFLVTDRASFLSRVMPEGSRCFLAYNGGALAGFCSVHENGILALCVAPEYRCGGIGSSLLRQAEEAMRQAGYKTYILGRSTAGYLCQGVPYAKDAPVPVFFEKRGYVAAWSSIDMVLNLHEFSLQTLALRPQPDGVIFRMASPKELCDVRVAVAQTEPYWVRFYAGDISVFVAEFEGEIVGFVLLLSDMCFATNFLGRVGGLGCLGVVPKWREKGIGLRLAAHATQALLERGMDWSYLGYTWLEDWYGRLGYRVYARFWMGEKHL